jgi:dTDP-4-dehydrorhamnose 3,5-epimerase-like enzyme
MSTVEDCRIIQLPKIPDHRGNLSFIEGARHIPFVMQRVYWVYDVPGGEVRNGGHAYKELQEFIVALSGSFDVVLDDGHKKKTIALNRSYFGLYVPNMIWRQIQNFSTNAFCLVLASLPYAEDDYIRDYPFFLRTCEAQTEQ